MIERYGFDLSDGEWRDAALAVINAVNGDFRKAILKTQFRSAEIWHVKVGAASLVMVWKPDSAVFVTVLPEKRGH